MSRPELVEDAAFGGGVVSLVPPVAPCSRIVEILEQALAHAKAGELRSVVVVGSGREGSLTAVHIDGDDGAALLGALVLSQADVTDALRGED